MVSPSGDNTQKTGVNTVQADKRCKPESILAKKTRNAKRTTNSRYAAAAVNRHEPKHARPEYKFAQLAKALESTGGGQRGLIALTTDV